MRIRLSHAYGMSAVRVAAASVVCTAAGPAVEQGTLARLTFGGAAEVEIPARGEVVSDDVPLAVTAGASVTVILYFAATTGPATFHAQAFATGYRGEGDLTEDLAGQGYGETTESWYFLTAVEVDAARTDGIALFGDSITDGFGSTPPHTGS